MHTPRGEYNPMPPLPVDLWIEQVIGPHIVYMPGGALKIIAPEPYYSAAVRKLQAAGYAQTKRGD
jgi:hypothetical protein